MTMSMYCYFALFWTQTTARNSKNKSDKFYSTKNKSKHYSFIEAHAKERRKLALPISLRLAIAPRGRRDESLPIHTAS